MPFPTESERSAFYVGLIEGTLLGLPHIGPMGVQCTCDFYAPCVTCEERDRREREVFDQSTAALVDAAVIERNYRHG